MVKWNKPPLTIALFELPHLRSRTVCDAIENGINRLGDICIRRRAEAYREVDCDVAVHYGLAGGLREVAEDYRKAGKHSVYIDLGYFGRREGGRYVGYHKVSLNTLHPTAETVGRQMPPGRFARFGIPVEAWKPYDADAPILIAGMGPKAAWVFNLPAEHWEREIIGRLRNITDRKIVYRPKPSWIEAVPIEGVGYCNPKTAIDPHIRGAHVVVTHHSNAAVEAVLAGTPVYCVAGAALAMAETDLTKIERPYRPSYDKRLAFAQALAWCQFNVQEMKDGTAWSHIRQELTRLE